MIQLHPLELKTWLEHPARKQPVLVDVRETWEYQYCHIEGSLLIPLRQIPERLAELDPDAEIVMICHHGVRSYRAGLFLAQAGFTNVYNLQGGVEAWARDADPAMRQY